MGKEQYVEESKLALPPGQPEHSRLLLERMVLRQRDYEQNVYGDSHTGNDVLRNAVVGNGIKNIIYDTTVLPEITKPNKHILDTYYNPHSKAVREIFLSTIANTAERDAIKVRFSEKEANLSQNLPFVYGTSGTETNPKEIGNTLGAVAMLEAAGQPTLGVYFVEDQGHPMRETIAGEVTAYSHYLAKKRNIKLDEARSIAKDALNQLYQDSLKDIYDPQSPEVQAILTYVEPNKQKMVEQYFKKCSDALSTPEGASQLACDAENIKVPSPATIRESYTTIGLPEDIIELMEKMAATIRNNPEDFPNATIADYRTILQGVIGLKLAYYAYGAEKMPLWAVEKWSTIYKKNEDNKSFTVGSAKKLLSEQYPDKKRRVVNFACPCCKEEHGLDTEGKTSTLTQCGFEEVSQAMDNVPLHAWKWGGNSGVMYYESFIKMAEEGGEFAIFMDNYEANGPQSRIVDLYKKGKGDNLYLYPPKTRTWLVGPHIPYKKTNRKQPELSDIVDSNASLGAAPPADVSLAYIESLEPNSKQKILRSWFEMSGEYGLDNTCGALMLDANSAQLQSLPYELLRKWQHVSTNVAIDQLTIPGMVRAEEVLDVARISQNGEIFAVLTSGTMGNEIANLASQIQTEHTQVQGSIRTVNNMIATGKIREAQLIEEMGIVNQLGEKISQLRRKIAVDILYPERDRLLQREFKTEPTIPFQTENATRLKNALVSNDKNSIEQDRDLVAKMKAEVVDIWTEDKLFGKDTRRKSVVSKEKGPVKKEIERELELEIHNRLAVNPEYQDLYMQLTLLREKIDWFTKRNAYKQLQESNRHLESDVLPRLQAQLAHLEKRRETMVWDVLTTLAVSSQKRAQ